MRKGERIRQEAARRGIEFLIHFTHTRNLPDIVTHGILPRTDLAARGLDAIPSSRERLDGNDGAVSLSVSAISAPMFAAKVHASGHPHWTVLIVDPSVLWKCECRFLRRGAARNETLRHRGYLGGPWAFGEMFADTNGATPDAQPLREGLPAWLPTFPDAEIQVLGCVPSEAIMGAWLDRSDFAQAVQDELDRIPGPERDVVVCPFSPGQAIGNREWIAPRAVWAMAQERLRREADGCGDSAAPRA